MSIPAVQLSDYRVLGNQLVTAPAVPILLQLALFFLQGLRAQVTQGPSLDPENGQIAVANDGQVYLPPSIFE